MSAGPTPVLPPQDMEHASAAERHARAVSGFGSMSDAVVAAFLATELNQFLDDDPESSGVISLLRVHSALEDLRAILLGSSRMNKTALRSIWGLLQQEMNIAIARNKASEVKPLRKMFLQINNEGYNTEQEQWDMGFVREALAKGWPRKQALPVKLGASKLGPLRWWYASWAFTSGSPLTRQDIYNGAVKRFQESHDRRAQAAQSSRTEATNASQVSGSSRPVRKAASASIAANNDIKVKDNNALDPTYFPPEVVAKTNEQKMSTPPPVPEVTPTAGPAPAGNATSRKARPAPSPWLPPNGFSADLKWQVKDYNRLYTETLEWPADQPIPDTQVWEHPKAHGCPVDETTGQAVQYEVPCTTCTKYERNCIWRGSKACLPCFWEKGSRGPCKGGTPPTKTPEEQKFCKPDYARRKAYFDDLASKGKIQYPSHFLDETGRARRSTTSATTGRASTYEDPAPGHNARSPAAKQSSGPPVAPSPIVSHPTETSSDHPAASPGPSHDLQSPTSPAVASSAPPAPTSFVSPPAQSADKAPASSDAIVSAGPVPVVHATPPAPKNNSVYPEASGVALALVPAVGTNHVSQCSSQVNTTAAKFGGDGAGSGHPPREETSGPREEYQDVQMADISDSRSQGKKKCQRSGDETTALVSITNDVHLPKRPHQGTAQANNNENAPDQGLPRGSRDQDTVLTEAPAPTRSSEPQLPSQSDDTAYALSRSVSLAPSVIANEKGKGRAKTKPSGEDQRRTAQNGIKIRSVVPGTRSLPRAGSPTEFPAVRPEPVIPDDNMEFTGEHAGVVRVPHPVLNVAGDVVFVNVVERAVRQELRDGLRDLRDDLREDRQMQRNDRDFQREMMTKIDALHADSRGSPVTRPTPGTGPAAKDSQVHGVDNNPLTDNAADDLSVPSSASLHELATMLTALNLKLDVKLDPLSARVQTLDEKLNPLSANVASLTLNYNALLTRMDRVENQLNAAEADTPSRASVTMPGHANGATSSSIPKGQQTPSEALRTSTISGALTVTPGQQAPDNATCGDRSLSPSFGSRQARPDVVAPLPSGQFPLNLAREAGRNSATSPHSPPETAPRPNSGSSGFQLQQAVQRDRAILIQIPARSLSRDATPIPVPSANPRSPSGPPVVTRDSVESMCTPPSSLSPLTEDSSPGTIKESSPTNIAKSSPTDIAESSSGNDQDHGSGDAGGHDSGDVEEQGPGDAGEHGSGEDDLMETGDTWAPNQGKRGADEAGITGDDRAVKRHAGDNASDAEEDAEGSIDESLAAPASRTEDAPRGQGRGKGRGGARGRCIGTRNRPMPRSG
ncbi:unnamed protein product [Peniophora sp. CBMAI 1063]|nr:unnamed protein product [Peniophora sp. CBMAI 1063]